MKNIYVRALAAGLSAAVLTIHTLASEYLWVEAEHSADVQGSNTAFTATPPLEKQRGWGISGPGVAAEWSQGGESEWTSIAAHPEENNALARYAIEVPAAGHYRVWVRYADYQRKKEVFRVRVNQGGKSTFDHVFGDAAVIPEDDEVKLMWGWAFAWAGAEADLPAGPAELQLVVDTPSEARRHIDAFLITDDLNFRPLLREKPVFHYWAPLEGLHEVRATPALATPAANWTAPAAWRTPPIAGREFQMFFNMPADYWKQDKIPEEKRVLYPYNMAQPGDVTKKFVEHYGGKKDLPIWSSKLNAPIIYLSRLPDFLSDDSSFLAWLKETKSNFGILLNYALPPRADSFGDKGPMIARNLASVQDQFAGYMSGENIGYANSVNYSQDLFPQLANMAPGVAGRGQILDRVHELYTAGLEQKFSTAYGVPAANVPFGPNPWTPLVSALSTDMYPHVHALAEWGERTLAHEATANSPAFGLNWAFLRGASRQFGRNWAWYHSSNFGDTATTFVAGQNIAGPYTNYHHSHYDAFSGAGLVWYRKSYYAAYMAGAAAVYLEQGFDQYFIPSPGEPRVQLSPFGRITDEFMRFAERHPDRGVPYTPIAFLLDAGHGWYHYENEAGAFSIAAAHNPAVLNYSRHDAMIRDLFNIAYFPLPKVEGEPLLSPRLSFLNSPLGDVYDVLVTSNAPKARDIAAGYRAIVLSGDVRLSAEWGATLRQFVENGGTLVVTEDQVQGPGAAALELPGGKAEYATNHRVQWQPSSAGENESIASNTYRYRKTTPPGEALATTGDGQVVAVQRAFGKGKLIWIGVPKGLGLDDRATPLMSKIMLHLRAGLLPVEVQGEVEYSLNRNATGWVVTLFNNRGNYKPQHGLGIPRREESAGVTISTNFGVTAATEWTEEAKLEVNAEGSSRRVSLEVPAGSIRIVHLATP
ncbi:MAG TPA: hypothetical protein VGO11_07675 [Chthoniobacteraceae bacterium]|jgi:hypothetical protein|nr:hypothetical protein [Chthoniobacteraceae bacterium]